MADLITITDLAKEKLQILLAQNAGKDLRVLVRPGWGGASLGLALDEPDTDEKPLEVNGIRVLITERGRQYAEGAVVDYIKEEHREGFTIKAAEPSAPCFDDDW